MFNKWTYLQKNENAFGLDCIVNLGIFLIKTFFMHTT